MGENTLWKRFAGSVESRQSSRSGHWMTPAPKGEIADADWSGAPLRGLIGHILTPISKTEMPRIAGLFVKVVRAHGEREREQEYDDAGRALIQMRHLMRDYTIPDEACATYRVRRSCGRIKGREQTPAQINRG